MNSPNLAPPNLIPLLIDLPRLGELYVHDFTRGGWGEVQPYNGINGPTGCLPCTDFTGDGICDPNPFGINDPMPHEGVDAVVVGIPH